METAGKRQRGRPRSFNGPAENSSSNHWIAPCASSLSSQKAMGCHSARSLPLRGLPPRPPTGCSRRLRNMEWSNSIELISFGRSAWKSIAWGQPFSDAACCDRARTIMQELMEKTGETANLGVAEEDCVVFVSQVETHQAIRAFFRPGSRSPFHASGIGKAILAHLPGDRVTAIVRKAGLEAYTPKTLADAPALARDLARIRTQGFSVDDEERHPGMRCIAAPVFNEFGEPVAGVSISGPTVRIARASGRYRPAGSRRGCGSHTDHRRASSARTDGIM